MSIRYLFSFFNYTDIIYQKIFKDFCFWFFFLNFFYFFEQKQTKKLMETIRRPNIWRLRWKLNFVDEKNRKKNCLKKKRRVLMRREANVFIYKFSTIARNKNTKIRHDIHEWELLFTYLYTYIYFMYSKFHTERLSGKNKWEIILS